MGFLDAAEFPVWADRLPLPLTWAGFFERVNNLPFWRERERGTKEERRGNKRRGQGVKGREMLESGID